MAYEDEDRGPANQLPFWNRAAKTARRRSGLASDGLHDHGGSPSLVHRESHQSLPMAALSLEIDPQILLALGSGDVREKRDTGRSELRLLMILVPARSCTDVVSPWPPMHGTLSGRARHLRQKKPQNVSVICIRMCFCISGGDLPSTNKRPAQLAPPQPRNPVDASTTRPVSVPDDPPTTSTAVVGLAPRV